MGLSGLGEGREGEGEIIIFLGGSVGFGDDHLTKSYGYELVSRSPLLLEIKTPFLADDAELHQ